MILFKNPPTVKVVNIPNTTDENPPNGYSSWLDYWIAQPTTALFKGCSNIHCEHYAKDDNKTQINGSHVKRVDDGEKYIIPLCNACNNYENKDEMTVYLNHLVICPKV